MVLYGFSFCAAGFCTTDLCIYFYAAPDFVRLLSYNSWVYTASYIQLDSVIQIYLATFVQLLVLFGFFPMAPGFVWFLMIGF